MAITRSGPPPTHDSVLWRVPLSAPPSSAWQKSFQTSGNATSVASASRVQFEHAALTFRSGAPHVPEWVESIDRWIAYANQAQAVAGRGTRERGHPRPGADRRPASASDRQEWEVQESL